MTIRDQIREILYEYGTCTDDAVTHLTSLFRSEREKALEDAAKEGDRFLESLKGRDDDRRDGAFVAITRLVRNIRRMAQAGEREGHG